MRSRDVGVRVRTNRMLGRRGRTALLGTVAVVALILIGGCSSTAPPSPVQVVRDAFVATQQAGTARIALSSRTTAAGQDVVVSGNGVLDLAAQGADVQLQVPALGGALHTVFSRGIVYAQLPPQLTAVVPGGKPWVSVDLDRISRQQFGASLAQLGGGVTGNPAQQLAYLQGVRDDVRVVGPEPVDGVPTTHYVATIDLDRTPAAQDPATRPAIDRLEAQLGSATLPVEVWVDEEGRLRRVVQTVTSAPRPDAPSTTSTSSVTFAEFGVPARIVPPPADQVTDLGALLPTG